MNPQTIIDQFFKTNGPTLPGGIAKKSILLAIFEDLSYNKQVDYKFRPLGLTSVQKEYLKTIMPSFTVVLLFTTAIDLLSRVINKSEPGPRQNRIFFINCATNWFGLSDIEADQLWRLRNSITHSYSLVSGHRLVEFGSGRIVQQSVRGWEFYLNSMWTTLKNSMNAIYDHLSSESAAHKQETARYLENHGFILISP